MINKLEPTGERLIEDHYRRSLVGYIIYLMHSASYSFVEQYCRGKHVLDLGCGSGYGAARIAKVAKYVDAVDVAEEAVSYAVEHHSKPNISFSRIEPDTLLPFADASFDVVLSFQVIEHVRDDESYIREASRVLVDGGLLALITPDRKHRLLPTQKPWNRWHLREYSHSSLCRLVNRSFYIKKTLKMGGTSEATDVELRRYRRMKWMTLPLTLPLMPEAWRRGGLDWLHRLKTETPDDPSYQEPAFGEEVIEFAEDVVLSLNLVIIATPRREI